MESDKYITICESVGGVQQIATIDMTADNTVTRHKISAEAAIMNPNSKIIALKGTVAHIIFLQCSLVANSNIGMESLTKFATYRIFFSCPAIANIQFGSPQ
jgi:hypothetical protein